MFRFQTLSCRTKVIYIKRDKNVKQKYSHEPTKRKENGGKSSVIIYTKMGIGVWGWTEEFNFVLYILEFMILGSVYQYLKKKA